MFRLALVSLSALLLSAQSNPHIEAAMKKMIAEQEVPGTVTLVASKTKVTHLQALGQAGPDNTGPMRTDSIFWIASMTKPITGTAILMLQDEGKLSVDDLVSKHLPEFAALKTPSGQAANLTLKQLLTHSSGLAEPTAAEAAAATKLAELMPAILSKPLLFEPGAKWQYCQSGINTLGRIVEVISGMPFEQFLAKRLFEPLGMKDTTFYIRPDQVSRVVIPARKEKEGQLVPAKVSLLHGKPATATDRYPAPNGGLYSTAPDYAQFARMILNRGKLNGKRYLSEKAVRQMTSIQSGDLKTGFTPGNGWGLAWCVVKTPQGVSAMLSPGTHGHGGAYGTQAWIDPVKGVAYILMVQRSNFANSDDSPVRLAFQTAATL
ncbi:serine hydrolase domain-containing protein [Bryobacter aggregatus]|uniref:serine hydrolase domain-containing protein n=1 Tax=Bryobacter aggregatus TaxID=360054 RepID=UPI00056B1038|nr:serine hydrolase domain-containing protein [Bryobacter aggregatus]